MLKKRLLALLTAPVLWASTVCADVGAFGGFEEGDTGSVQNCSGTRAIVTGPVRTGTYSFRINPTTTGTGTCSIRGYSTTGSAPANGVDSAVAYYRTYFRYATKPASNDEEIAVVVDTSAVAKLYLRLNSAGNIVAYDSTNTAVATGATVLSVNTWYIIEISVGTGATSNYEIKLAQDSATLLDPATELSGTGAFGTTNNGGFALGKVTNRNGNSVDFFYDDYFVSPTAYPGPGGTKILKPAADGTNQTFTIGAGAGSHYQIVNTIPTDGDTSYLLSDLTVGHLETEAITSTATAGVSGIINGVRSSASVKRDGASNGSVMCCIKSGATTDCHSSSSISSSYVMLHKLYLTDPNTGSAWTTINLDAVEVGLKENSASNKTRLSETFLMVDFLPPTPTSTPTITPTATPTLTATPTPTITPTIVARRQRMVTGAGQ